MGVRGVVIGSLDALVSQEGAAMPGAAQMIDELRGNGISVALANGNLAYSRDWLEQRLANAGLRVDEILARQDVGQNKGSPVWVDKACEAFGLQRNQLAWLGDNDLDMRCAVNTKVVYFHASWAKSGQYGIKCGRPSVFSLVVNECFAREADWYWQLTAKDQQGRDVTDRALIDGGGANIPALKYGLIDFLKRGRNPTVGPFSVRDFIMLHLIGSIYAEGLHLRADVWTAYPGSGGSGPNRDMAFVIDFIVKQFRRPYADDLLVRHTPALDSGETRAAGKAVGFDNQINTVHVNPSYRRKIVGKTVMMIDDFETQGWSAECARNLLLVAGAHDVICVNIGKYPGRRYVADMKASFDPFSPQTHPAFGFTLSYENGKTDNAALNAIHDSYLRVAARAPAATH